MKKNLLLLLLLLSTTLFSQSKKVSVFPINRTLKLGNVATGNGTEKILVRDLKGFVKEIDKSLIVPTLSVSPNLQEVLVNGNTYSASGNYDSVYMSFTNSYPTSNNIKFTADSGISIVNSSLPSVQSRLNYGSLMLSNSTYTMILTIPNSPQVGQGVLVAPVGSGTLTAITQGTLANPNTAGNFGMLMTDGNYLYICISQGVWKKVQLSNL